MLGSRANAGHSRYAWAVQATRERDKIERKKDFHGWTGRLVMMKPSRAYSIAATALCLMLGACNSSTEPAAPPPSAGSFHAELFEISLGQAREKVSGAVVTGAFFRDANVLPLLGREFLDEEYQTANPRVVIMAASLWQRRFAGDPALIGRTLNINGRQHTIVGILPNTFQLPTGAELWVPQNR